MSTWSDIAGIVGKAAPVIGGLLGGPAGAAVGGLISSALGTDNNPDAVSAALAGNPDALVKVQELQTNAKVQLQQLAVTAEQNRMLAANAQYSAEAADRDSARKLAAQQPKDFMRPLLAIVLMTLTAYIVWAVMGGHADGVIKDTTAALTVGTLIGYVLSENKQVLGFYFGMTQDSSRTNAVVRDFAVAPGSVTTSSSAPSQSQVHKQTPDVFQGS